MATAFASPASVQLNTTAGLAVLCRIFIPPGPRGEVFPWLLYHSTKIAPVGLGYWENLDDDILTLPLNLELPPHETQFSLYAASPNANFKHTLTLEILVDDLSDKRPSPGSATLLTRLAGLFGS